MQLILQVLLLLHQGFKFVFSLLLRKLTRLWFWLLLVFILIRIILLVFILVPDLCSYPGPAFFDLLFATSKLFAGFALRHHHLA